MSHKGGKTGTATAAPYQDLVVKNVTAPGFPPEKYCVDLIAHNSQQ